MATDPNPIRWLRRGAFAAGLVAAVTLVLLGRLPHGATPLALDATVTTGPTGELAVEPAGPVASVAGLRPGAGALRGSVRLENQTDAALVVHVRVRPSIADADAALQVRVGDLYSGPAGGLRAFSTRALRLAPHAAAELPLSAWLPAGSPEGWRGRSVTLPLEYQSTIAGAVRR
ncbi:MAG: hypothetical protein QOG63_1750 [Thermoleophilaceae bacterium]|jgi:hypothetical protein|nr:hypothetical protein [Thermoleophilaceae bacterium]